MASILDRVLNASLGASNGTTERPTPAPAPAYTPNPNVQEDDVMAVGRFPLEVLPKRLQRVVHDCHQFLSYNEDFTACGMLAAAAMAIGRTHKAEYQWSETGCLYMALVAPPGTGKTHPLLFTLGPIIQKNKQAIKEFMQAKLALEREGVANSLPSDRQCLFSDFTIESLTKAVRGNRRGISVYMDELAGFFRNFNRYSSGSEGEFWLQNWSNSPIAITRMGHKYFLEWCAISITGTIQPSVLDEIGKGGRAGNGFVERILFCYPDEVEVIKLKRRNERSDTHRHISRYYNPVLEHLLNQNLEILGNDEEEDVPHMVTFTPDADDLLTDYINALKGKIGELSNEYLQNVYAKMQTYTIRFALILNRLRVACEYIDNDNPDFPPHDHKEITVADVDRACILVEYFLKHALKAHHSISGATPVDKQPRNIQQWYKAIPRGTEITTAEVEAISATYKVSRATMFRMLNEPDHTKRLFVKIRHGIYERIY